MCCAVVAVHSRHFIDQTALDDHFRTKVHKRRMKALEDEPYSVAESERAGGGCRGYGGRGVLRSARYVMYRLLW